MNAYSTKHQALLEELERCGIRDPRVLEALARVPRHLFVPESVRARAYDNCALPIGQGQTISQPLMVAHGAEALELRGDEKVLDVGTGSGYQAAVLSCLASEVYSIERLAPLYEDARERLAALGYDNVRCALGDGSLGLPAFAPFDAIIVAAASPDVPEPLVEQLGVGGRLVLPIGTRGDQMFRRLRKTGFDGEVASEDLMLVRFVPLVGDRGWDAQEE